MGVFLPQFLATPGETHNLLGRDANRLYLAPHPLLRSYIAHYTVTFPNAETALTGSLTLVPDASGCIVVRVEERGARGTFWGPTTRTVTVPYDFNDAPCRVFVEFLPCGAYHFTGYPLEELRDKTAGLEELFPQINHRIVEILEQAKTVAELANGLDKLFLSLMNREDSLVGALLADLRDDGMFTVREAAESLCYSQRHLNRLCNRSLGMSLKTYSRLLRINKALSELNETALTGIAQNLGYYDQPHFNHDFKAVCGVSPTDYLHSMSEFYKESFKF